MGGACFALCGVIAALASLMFSAAVTEAACLVCIIALCCGAVGLADDLSKLQKKANAGVSARLRLTLEFALGLILGGYLLWKFPAAWLVNGGGTLSLAFLAIYALGYVLFSGFLVAATTNAVNLHDGMDGLAGGTSALVLATMAVILSASGAWDLAMVAAAVAGSLGAFLLFNRYPAAVFMGDTGSLFLGGLMAALAMAGGLQLFFIPLSLIYIVETISVMAQVVYFKLTKPYPGQENLPGWRVWLIKLTKKLPGEGKRLFRMAPLHHHFEALAAEKEIAEWQVVACFWLVQAILCFLVLAFYLSHIISNWP